MDNMDAFITRFGGWTESYFFYNGEVELRYDPKAHVYLLVTGDDLIPQDGVTSVCHIIDRSDALMPWACKMMAQKLIATAPRTTYYSDDNELLSDRVSVDWPEFEKLVNDSKAAHKEKVDDAAHVGSLAHNWIEKYIKMVIASGPASIRVQELLSNFPPDDRATNCCHAALDWIRQHNVRWLCTERKIYSREHGYAGTMDGLCYVDSCSNPICCPNKFKDRLSVADWKSSNFLYPEYLLQTAAYMNAYIEETGELVQDRWVIRLGKEDGEFDPWHAEGLHTFREDLEGFLLCLRLGRQMAGIKARIKQHDLERRASIKAEQHRKREEAKEAERKRKEEAKALKAFLRAAELQIKCPKADKYKGRSATTPKCNNGTPCQTCMAKWLSSGEIAEKFVAALQQRSQFPFAPTEVQRINLVSAITELRNEGFLFTDKTIDFIVNGSRDLVRAMWAQHLSPWTRYLEDALDAMYRGGCLCSGETALPDPDCYVCNLYAAEHFPALVTRDVHA